MRYEQTAVPEPGDSVVVSMGRYRNVKGRITEVINEDMVLVELLVPAQLAVRTSEIRFRKIGKDSECDTRTA
jgi:ribosomal protein L24